ncbi:unnamed protein product [Hyaloperonospora brassicae]|uniref:Exoribonuclease phosphorolytic domain-containing protein n=1 Tax=Hyaloperonospora brassicae TaxID=162125 RepID=A0AAV0TDE6_HYABA|nr:unnamed protein product [Hyaloperonospora brassicae]
MATTATTTTTARRQDGRNGNDLRPLASEQGALFRADGSARMSHGSSTVLAAVYGPGQARNWRSEKSDRATVDVCFKLAKGVLIAINAVCLALIDAGIPMVSVITASSCGIAVDGCLNLDPSLVEEEEAVAWVTTARSSTSDGVLTCITSGLLSEEQYFACSEACQRASESVAAFFRIVQEKKHPIEPTSQ